MKAFAVLLIMAPVHAGAFSLDMPLDCILGETCFIQQYMDRDPGPEHSDFTCGPLSYDTHSGTDFALYTLAAMHKGVTVRAAAAGTVKGVRDGMPDILVTDPAAPALNGRDCGNGLVIDHGDGWETQYCHMAKGSLVVKSGEPVALGQPLGLVGISGNTEFPHLHLSVRRQGTEIDPFDPDGAASCGPGPDPALWSTPLPYAAGGLIEIGLSAEIPDWAALKAGLSAATPDKHASALVIWAHYFGNRAGDVLDLTINGPDSGQVISDSLTLDRPQAQAFRAIGKRLQGSGWPSGGYNLTATLKRDGAILDQITTTVEID